ncbi:MAG: hypothetical protein H0T79_05875, partial [Deltaproteobacteria bacterium]|nr:hypothetical protein [Deltaproteobacteria bacterium]
MDRSLKWRFLALLGTVVFCVATLASSVVDTEKLPTWFTRVFSKRINLGLDLQGGVHIVYNIALDKAVEDRASEIKRDLESRFSDEKVAATVKTPQPSVDMPIGAVSVQVPDAAKRAEVLKQIESDYSDTVSMRDCQAVDGKDAICFQVSSKFAEDTKKSALTNAVNTIRERIDEKGVAEPSVIEKGDDIIVELPGDPNDPIIQETKDIIARTAKLEFKVIDDGSPYMNKLFAHVADKKGKTIDPLAIGEGVFADIDSWRPEEGGGRHDDPYLYAHDREESVPVEDAKAMGCLNATNKRDIKDGRITCKVTGRRVLERYLKALLKDDPSFKLPDDRQIGYERNEATPESKDQRVSWRTYYLDRAVKLTGTAISNAYRNYDPNTNRPLVLLDFNRFGGRVFGDLTAEIVGKKLATILDETVKSAPIINGAIRGGRASITMGGSDPTRQEQERNELVNVLKTGSLPAPLK